MAETPEIISALPSLAQGGAWVVLASVLIWIIWQSSKFMQAQAKSHREERDKQDELHQERVETLMASHKVERAEWVTTINAASDKYARAQSEQGDRIARAIEKALRSPRSQ